MKYYDDNFKLTHGIMKKRRKKITKQKVKNTKIDSIKLIKWKIFFNKKKKNKRKKKRKKMKIEWLTLIYDISCSYNDGNMF